MKTAETPPGIRAEELAQITGASLRTARRWRRSGRMPAGLALAVALLRDGDLGVLDPAWKGWTLTRGQLYSPENWGFTPGEIAAVPMLHQLKAEVQKQRRIAGAEWHLLPLEGSDNEEPGGRNDRKRDRHPKRISRRRRPR